MFKTFILIFFIWLQIVPPPPPPPGGSEYYGFTVNERPGGVEAVGPPSLDRDFPFNRFKKAVNGTRSVRGWIGYFSVLQGIDIGAIVLTRTEEWDFIVDYTKRNHTDNLSETCRVVDEKSNGYIPDGCLAILPLSSKLVYFLLLTFLFLFWKYFLINLYKSRFL